MMDQRDLRHEISAIQPPCKVTPHFRQSNSTGDRSGRKLGCPDTPQGYPKQQTNPPPKTRLCSYLLIKKKSGLNVDKVKLLCLQGKRAALTNTVHTGNTNTNTN